MVAGSTSVPSPTAEGFAVRPLPFLAGSRKIPLLSSPSRNRRHSCPFKDPFGTSPLQQLTDGVRQFSAAQSGAIADGLSNHLQFRGTQTGTTKMQLRSLSHWTLPPRNSPIHQRKRDVQRKNTQIRIFRTQYSVGFFNNMGMHPYFCLRFGNPNRVFRFYSHECRDSRPLISSTDNRSM